MKSLAPALLATLLTFGLVSKAIPPERNAFDPMLYELAAIRLTNNRTEIQCGDLLSKIKLGVPLLPYLVDLERLGGSIIMTAANRKNYVYTNLHHSVLSRYGRSFGYFDYVVVGFETEASNRDGTNLRTICVLFSSGYI